MFLWVLWIFCCFVFGLDAEDTYIKIYFRQDCFLFLNFKICIEKEYVDNQKNNFKKPFAYFQNVSGNISV